MHNSEDQLLDKLGAHASNGHVRRTSTAGTPQGGEPAHAGGHPTRTPPLDPPRRCSPAPRARPVWRLARCTSSRCPRSSMRAASSSWRRPSFPEGMMEVDHLPRVAATTRFPGTQFNRVDWTDDLDFEVDVMADMADPQRRRGALLGGLRRCTRRAQPLHGSAPPPSCSRSARK